MDRGKSRKKRRNELPLIINFRHGDGKPVEMISIQMMTIILIYTALYVKTVVKYYEGEGFD